MAAEGHNAGPGNFYPSLLVRQHSLRPNSVAKHLFSINRFEGENLQSIMSVSMSLLDEGKTSYKPVTGASGGAAGAVTDIKHGL